VTVPKVAGLPVEDAIQTLNGAGLRADVKEVFSDKADPGIVMSQDPKANIEVDKGSIVTLRVSKGVEQVAVPNVIGEDQGSAEAILTDAGLVPNAVVVESDQPEGTVVGQSPNGGAVPKGTEVEIDVSAGPPPPPETVAVPGVTGKTEQEATQTLSDAGFDVQVVDQPTLDPNEDGIVLSQDPPEGQEVDPGTTVTILVGRFL
jgi:serine/threonine-protein kinase